MSDSIHRLVYISDNQIEGTDAEIHEEIQTILQIAREANTRAGITGALMFNSGCFAQVLEGSQDSVEETFERIQCDPRHNEVVVLSFEEIQSRGFSSWSMAYVGCNETTVSKFENIKSESGFSIDKIPAGRIFELLHEHLIDAEGSDDMAAAA